MFSKNTENKLIWKLLLTLCEEAGEDVMSFLCSAVFQNVTLDSQGESQKKHLAILERYFTLNNGLNTAIGYIFT